MAFTRTALGPKEAELPRPVLVGIEATGSMQWFLNLMGELGIECRGGHPATIRAAEPRKQKHDRRDADLILRLLVENRFPAIWLPSKELLDLRALLLHRHQWVRIRTRVQNALQDCDLPSTDISIPKSWAFALKAKAVATLEDRIQIRFSFSVEAAPEPSYEPTV